MIPIQDQIAEIVIDYYAQFPDSMREDILHTQEVVAYTHMIALGEGLSEERLVLMECAAWMHDIGCPRSKDIYGNSLPVNQQSVGGEVCEELLHDFVPLSSFAKRWIIDVVKSHHQAQSATKLAFEPLFEADLIANLLSGYHEREKAQMLFDTLVTTDSGKRLFRGLNLIKG